ncbi:MAG: BatD family protein [Planctomycetia bacterium]|nr:BatD family protein [Planctomycetia bacterium]
MRIVVDEARNLFACRAATLIIAVAIVAWLSLANSSLANTTHDPRQATAQQGHLQTQIVMTPDRPLLSDSITMTITTTGDSDWTVRLPEFNERYGDFNVTGVALADPVIVNGRETRVMTLTLTPTKIGEFMLPPVPFSAVRNDETTSWTVPAGEIKVESRYDRDVAQEDLAPLRGAMLVFPWLASILALLAVVLAAGWLFWLKRRRRYLPATENTVPPWQRAIELLDELMASKLYASDVKAFYLQLTAIVRWCIEETTGLRAPEQTTEEFLASLGRGPNRSLFNEEQRDGLKKFLEFSDLVKFAKFRPTLDEIFDGVQRARRVVEEQNMEVVKQEGERS